MPGDAFEDIGFEIVNSRGLKLSIPELGCRKVALNYI
jgi:hypothetical protein